MDTLHDARRAAASSSIRTLRNKLLDLTARNPLISFSHAKAVGTRIHVRAVDESLNALFAHIDEGRELPIRPVPMPPNEADGEETSEFEKALDVARETDQEYLAALEALNDGDSATAATAERRLRERVRKKLGLPARQSETPVGMAAHAARHGIDPSFDLPPVRVAATAEPRKAAGQIRFQTLLPPDRLERALAKIRDIARTVAEETGISTLHLAFGFLEWFESDSSDRAITSPLLLLRVDIDRRITRSHYAYFLEGVGDETQVNLTLSERLDRDFKIKLPDLSDEETPADYLARIEEEVCKNHPRWAVRYYVTLAHFPFARLAMFHDLDEENWGGAGGLAAHPLIGRILGGGGPEEAMFAVEHDVESADVQAKVPILVLEADASQHSAVYDVMTGGNLVIEGPPGTGKSQTITNIIAAALATGKTVLFVADKQAALQVVRDRLGHVELGAFCLELHSGKTRKKDVIDNLGARLAIPPGSVGAAGLGIKLRELEATRQALNRYVRILNEPLGAFGKTVHNVLWADRRRRHEEGEEAEALDGVILSGCEALTRYDIQRLADLLTRFERAAGPVSTGYGKPSLHPLYGINRGELPAVDFELALRELRVAFRDMNDSARIVGEFAAMGLEFSGSFARTLAGAEALIALPAEEDIHRDLFARLASAETRSSATRWIAASARYRDVLESLRRDGIEPGIVNAAEAAAALEKSFQALDGIVPVWMTVEGLPAWSVSLRSELASLLPGIQLAAELSTLFGLPTPTTISEVSKCLSGLDLAVEASPGIVSFITPELTGSQAERILDGAQDELTSLRARRDALATEWVIKPRTLPSDLRRHAAALRAGGLFGFARRETKAAKQAYAELRRVPGKAGSREMAEQMEAFADDLEALGRWQNDRDWRGALGIRFRGLDTDIGAADAVIKWAGKVRYRLPGADAVTTAVRGALLAGDGDRLRRIAAFGADSIRTQRLRLLVEQRADKSFAEIAQEIAKTVAKVEAIAVACARSGLPGGTAISGLPSIIARMGATHETRLAADAEEQRDPNLGGSLPDPAADPAPLKRAIALAEAVDSLRLPRATVEALFVMDTGDLLSVALPAAKRLATAVRRALASWETASSRLGIDEGVFFGMPILDLAPEAACIRIKDALAAGGELGSWIGYLREREEAVAAWLGGLLALWDERKLTCKLAVAFERVLYRGLARAAFARRPELERFSGLGQDEARARFKALDAEAAVLKRQALAADLSARPVPFGVGVGRKSDFTERSLLLAEAAKQKRHLPIRQLLDRAGSAIQALKPCFMMSPLSVAQYLKAGGPKFDLLVIDEASQMKPEDAIGAIARSAQMVVVGDPKQLPPSAFFARLDAADDDEAVEEQVDAESILDLASAAFRPMRRLRWHYRSRHGSLVAFSNREFYEDDLIVFPSPAETAPDQGVGLVKLDGVYKSRTNLCEVDAVCEAAVEHMRARPGLSLGIATMNQIQRDLIAERMDKLVADDAELQDYRELWSGTLERFFVKNLENVQGDERDVIFISTVFGPPSPGGKVRQTFGPISGASGHRRLNVLFTRAKHHVRLFTSLTPEDILAGSDGPRGPQVLRRYLAYAADGRLDAGTETSREPDSDFELFVRDRLAAAGYEAVPQVGVAGYFIDLAVRHPDIRGTFLLGVECDGATYHSSKSARDRDVLRQQILEGLGWTIYRVWSTDWFRDPAREGKKLIAFIDTLRGGIKKSQHVVP